MVEHEPLWYSLLDTKGGHINGPYMIGPFLEWASFAHQIEIALILYHTMLYFFICVTQEMPTIGEQR